MARLRPFSLSSEYLQRMSCPFNHGAAARQRIPPSPLSLKGCNAPSIVKKRIRMQERLSGASLGFSKRRNAVPIGAISSTGALVSDWGEGGEDDLNANEALTDLVKEQKNKKREEKKKWFVAGVDQTQLLEPHLLADPDSRFAEFYGVQIHHKIARPGAVPDVDSASPSVAIGRDQGAESKVNLPAILLHGFGASLFSWERVMPKLAEIIGAPVVAFDRPGFGFTSRTFPASASPSPSTAGTKSQQKFKNAYAVAFSAAATLAFIDFVKSDQAIVIAHSAGSLVALDAYFQSPERIAALVFVAPAVIAPLLAQQIAASKETTKKKGELEGLKKTEPSDPSSKFHAGLLWIWVKFTNFIRMTKKFVQLVLSKILGFLLRSPPAIWLVRRIMDKGGPWAVRYAFFDVLKADKYVLDGYTRPLQCRDWERALLEYCLALMVNTEEQASGKLKLQDVKCPVLVVTGDTDRIVPDWNSENLAKVFPNAEFKRIKNSGHLPHEESLDEFLEIIKDWLFRTLIKKTECLEPVIS